MVCNAFNTAALRIEVPFVQQQANDRFRECALGYARVYHPILRLGHGSYDGWIKWRRFAHRIATKMRLKRSRRGPNNGILFEGTKGRFFVNRGKIVGKPVENLRDDPLPEGAIEEVYGGKVSANHSANFIEAMAARKQPISDVWTHNRMLEICHLSNIAMRLDRELRWEPDKREVIADAQANSFLARENRPGFDIHR